MLVNFMFTALSSKHEVDQHQYTPLQSHAKMSLEIYFLFHYYSCFENSYHVI